MSIASKAISTLAQAFSAGINWTRTEERAERNEWEEDPEERARLEFLGETPFLKRLSDYQYECLARAEELRNGIGADEQATLELVEEKAWLLNRLRECEEERLRLAWDSRNQGGEPAAELEIMEKKAWLLNRLGECEEMERACLA